MKQKLSRARVCMYDMRGELGQKPVDAHAPACPGSRGAAPHGFSPAGRREPGPIADSQVVTLSQMERPRG